MELKIGEQIKIQGETDAEPRIGVVTGYDRAGNPETIPLEAAKSEEELMRYLGTDRALGISARVLAWVA